MDVLSVLDNIQKIHFMMIIPLIFNIKEQKTLFKMCSKITCDNPIYRFFLIKNWNFTSSGYCRLFIALNNQETINEFITLINESLDYKGASLNGLVDVIGSSSIICKFIF